MTEEIKRITFKKRLTIEDTRTLTKELRQIREKKGIIGIEDAKDAEWLMKCLKWEYYRRLCSDMRHVSNHIFDFRDVLDTGQIGAEEYIHSFSDDELMSLKAIIQESGRTFYRFQKTINEEIEKRDGNKIIKITERR